MASVEGAYRCAQCRTHRYLMAWAAALVEGPLGADGELTEYTWVEDCYLHADSIHCTRHIDAPVEKFRDGHWCRWWSCPTCGGKGVTGGSRDYPCNGGLEVKGRSRWDGRLHEGWLPARQYAALVAGEVVKR
jgi:hypothetical protein